MTTLDAYLAGIVPCLIVQFIQGIRRGPFRQACQRRFAWAALPNLAFSPAGGHLQAGAELPVVASFQSDARAQLAGVTTALRLTQISYRGPDPPAAWLAAPAGSLQAPSAESEHSVVAKSEKELAVKVRPSQLPEVECAARLACGRGREPATVAVPG